MVEETPGTEKKVQDKIKPSDLRPQAHFYELVSAQNPEIGRKLHFLYWWNKRKNEVVIEEVDIGGMRVEDSPVVQRQAKSPKEARRKITEDINVQRNRGFKIDRHKTLDKQLFEEGRVIQGMMIPYYEELIKDRRKNVNEAWRYFRDAEEQADRARAQEEIGKVLRKSVTAPSKKEALKKQKVNLRLALDERESGLRFYNYYLNERIEPDYPLEQYDSVYETYAKNNRQLEEITHNLARTDSLKEKNRLLKNYEKILKKRLTVHHKLAEKKGYHPVKGIPKEYLLGEKPKEKVELPKTEDEKPEKEEEKKPEKIEVQLKTKKPEPEAETQEVLVKIKKPETEKIEEKPFLDQIADEIRDKGKFQKELEGSDLNEIFEGVIAGLLSEQKDVKADVSVEPILIKNHEGAVSASVQLTEPIKAVIEINLVIANSQETGKIRKKNLDIKEKAGMIDIIKLKVFNLKGKAEEALSDLNGSLLGGLNSQLEPKGVRLTNISLSLEDNTLEVSASGEEINS